MMPAMASSVVLITGAGSGIGRAASVMLAKSGYRLGINARSSDKLTETNRLTGGNALELCGDVSDSSFADHVVGRTFEHFGRLDAVVHCAGYAPARGVMETTDDLWRRVIDTNLSAAFYLARAAWKIFVQQQSGVIVNISSIAAVDPFPGFVAYGAAKAGVNTLGLSLAREGQSLGIRVHTIAPGAVETPMFRALMTSDQYASDLTLKPDEVAEIILACLRGDLRHTSGSVITVRKTL